MIVVLSIAAKMLHVDLMVVQDLAYIQFEMPTLGLPQVDLTGWIVVELIIFGLMLAIVATIQTSLTARMVDQLTKTASSLNRESFGQGLTNFIICLFGGLAGSALVGQSKYNLKLGATSRLSTLAKRYRDVVIFSVIKSTRRQHSYGRVSYRFDTYCDERF